MIIVSLILGYIGVLKHQITLAEQREAVAVLDKQKITVAYNELGIKIKEQNEAILTLTKKAKEQKVNADKAEKKFQAAKLDAEYKQRILDNVKPNPKLSDCDNTRNLLNRLRGTN